MPADPIIPWWRVPFRLALIGFLAVAAFFLLTEHTAHTLGVLPYLFLLACLHHGHGGHGGHDAARKARPEGRRKGLHQDQG
jgi:hypothetical protein